MTDEYYKTEAYKVAARIVEHTWQSRHTNFFVEAGKDREYIDGVELQMYEVINHLKEMGKVMTVYTGF